MITWFREGPVLGHHDGQCHLCLSVSLGEPLQQFQLQDKIALCHENNLKVTRLKLCRRLVTPSFRYVTYITSEVTHPDYRFVLLKRLVHKQEPEVSTGQ